MFIDVIPPRRAAPDLRATYRYLGEIGGGGPVPKVVTLFSVRPASMRRMLRGWELMMWAGEEPRQGRELVAASVSRFNDCHY